MIYVSDFIKTNHEDFIYVEIIDSTDIIHNARICQYKYYLKITSDEFIFDRKVPHELRRVIFIFVEAGITPGGLTTFGIKQRFAKFKLSDAWYGN